jgi:hypothetical protein
MSKQALKIAAVILLSAGSLSFSTRPVSAQSFPVTTQSPPYAFEYGFIDDMDGTRRGCRIYSQAAQSQAEDNKLFRCEYFGARWDTSRDTHFWWCRLVHSRTTIITELQNREISLQRCLYRIGREVPARPAYGPAF